MKRRTCVYCRGKKIPAAYTRSDGNVVLRCASCELLFLRDWPDDVAALYQNDYFDKQQSGEAQPEVGYSTYAELGPYEFRWQQAMLRLFAGRPEVSFDGDRRPPQLLDVGCANGSFLTLARNDGYGTEGIELLDVAATQARSRGLRVHSKPFEQVGEPGQYDVVTAWEFIEHVADLKAVLCKVRSLLTADGVFLFSTPDAGAPEVIAEGERWIGYRSSLEHLTFLTRPFLARALTEIFGHPPLLFSFVYRSGAETYSTLVGVAREGGLRKEDEALGAQIEQRLLSADLTQQTEQSWLYVQFQQLPPEQINPELGSDEAAALRGWADSLRGDLKRAIPELYQGARQHRELWQMVAQSYKRQGVLDEAEQKYKLREAAAHAEEIVRLRQQIANQKEEITHLHNQWDKAVNSVTWKVGRGITSRIERIPLSKGLLSAVQRVQSSGLNGFLSYGIESARTRIDSQLPGRLARLAPQLVQRMSAAPKVFVLLPSVEWHLTLFQRPQHLARALAQLGNLVIYDETDLGPRRPRTAEDPPEFAEIEPNLFLFRGDPQLLTEIPNPILWAFTYNYHLKDAFGPTATVIYDWIDDLAVFPHDQKVLHDAHARAMSEADVVMSVARALDDQAKQQRSDALYLPNGVEYDRFAATDLPLPDDDAFNALVAQGKPIAGYYGALASWFDYELLKAVADARPSWNFVLIGVRFDGSLSATDMLERKNIHYLGPKPYPTLPRYLQRFDVAMIPFLINEITLATSPLKLYEYFAGGRATVTTPMPECMAYEEVLIAKDAGEFVSQLDLALERSRDPAFRAQVQALARQNTWQARAQQALDALRKLPERTESQSLTETTPRSRLSEVIGSLTQASLQSMAAALDRVAGERPRALVTQLVSTDRHAPQ